MGMADVSLELRSGFRTKKGSRATLINHFINGVGSVLEFFPSPERFDVWRVAEDIPIDEWPVAVRSLLNDLQEDASPRGVP